MASSARSAPLTSDAQREHLRRMIENGKNDIMHTKSKQTWNNEVLYGYYNDWKKRDEEAYKFGTYTNGRFSLDDHGRGKWFCCLTAKAVLAQKQNNKLDPATEYKFDGKKMDNSPYQLLQSHMGLTIDTSSRTSDNLRGEAPRHFQWRDRLNKLHELKLQYGDSFTVFFPSNAKEVNWLAPDIDNPGNSLRTGGSYGISISIS